MDESLFTAFAAVENKHWWFLARREIVLAVASRVVPAGAAVLDLGCGTGFVLERLRTRYDAYGVDVSPVALSICRARGLDQVWRGSPEDLSAVAGKTFASVFLLDVVEHMDDDAGVLRRVGEVLSPGGTVIVTVPALRSLWSRHDVMNQHRRRYTRRSLRSALERAGYEIAYLTYFNTYLFPLAAAARWMGRLLGPWAPAGLRVPPAPINAMLRWVFEAEGRRIGRPDRGKGFPIGVSLLAVARRSAA